ncbi:undecaprenyl-diphosphate phosphatase [Raineya orbicola]|uniref:Undecaprenyl-diphosphatase n=1 Tax=Raineya orbicola TaxID=2016530 RepID=A0A2N3ICK1_9BACT|nr:undecaprenyl-diphosphate phosphatase [Raineya orbicola]PKQ68009.1 putative bacitracin resistance protein [Raineya orbicola]
MSLWEAILLAIVEGITEFLPISSTGHMILTAALAQMKADDFFKTYIVAIQLGAIFSVVVLYWKRFFQSIAFYIKLLVGFIPAVLVGALLKKHIDTLLERVDVVAFALLGGGIILLFVDKWFAKNEKNTELQEISYQTAFWIGCFQCLAMVPGVSRSAATIVGGLTQGLNRRTSAEFSFFLALPTMFAATAKSIWDTKEIFIEQAQKSWLTLLVGNSIAFVVALLAIKFFIGYLTKYGFRLFGWYRIVVGLLILILLWAGVKLEML